MSDNQLVEAVPGEVVVAQDINQIIQALLATQYPRTTDGTTLADAGSLGTALTRFLSLFVRDISCSSINTGSINENVGLTKVEQAYSTTGQFVVPNGITKIYIELQAAGGEGGTGLDDGSNLKFLGAGGGGGGYVYFSQAVESGDIIDLDFSSTKNILVTRTSGASTILTASVGGGSDGQGYADFGSNYFGLYRNGAGGGVSVNQGVGATILTSASGGVGGIGGVWFSDTDRHLMPFGGFYGTASSAPTAIGGIGGVGGSSGNTSSVNGIDGNSNGFSYQPRIAYISYWS